MTRSITIVMADTKEVITTTTIDNAQNKLGAQASVVLIENITMRVFLVSRVWGVLQGHAPNLPTEAHHCWHFKRGQQGHGICTEGTNSVNKVEIRSI